ncbi:hydrogen gas-evolving membrane-bound hydrogenase subunit E [Aquimixticola soesokkakensis]|nr:hydrogen gas-evolving membrane-bound hydrogenase subunit E [Aquimixticola soesokkakensis]
MATPDAKPAPSGLIPVALAILLFVWFAQFAPRIASGEVIRAGFDWAPSLGVSLTFTLDGLSLIMALLITGIGALIHLYARDYMAGHPQFNRFALYLTAFMLAMLGVVTADNLMALFVFWELTTVTSYLLIGFDHDSANSRRSALQGMLVTGAGGLCLLAAFILIGEVAGTYAISQIPDGALKNSLFYTPITILVLLGAFTKSAQFPFHFWLPNAMAAPTPVSAYLHSATMVKAGVYLMARLHGDLGGSGLWIWTLTLAGGFTAVFASVLALRQTDLKTALAYTTLMALGTITLLLAAPVPYALTGAIAFLVVHSLYKAALFLVAGLVDHGTGTRDVTLLSGLGRKMPFTALGATLAALSMAGLPPMIGWIGKEVIYAGGLKTPMPLLVIGAALAANALMVAVAYLFAIRPFWVGKTRAPHAPHEGRWTMWIAPVVMGLTGLGLGIYPHALQQLVDPAVVAIYGGEAKAAGLHIWAGLGMPFYLSLATFTLGALIILAAKPLSGLIAALSRRLPVFDAGWDSFLRGLKAFAAWQTGVIQPGKISLYFAATFSVMVVAIGLPLVLMLDFGPLIRLPDLNPVLMLISILIVAGTGLVLRTRERITAIAGLGTVGIGISLIFILFSAPDVAITQLLVETLVVVLFAVAALRLPQVRDMTPALPRVVALPIALGMGAVVSLVTLAVTATPFDAHLTDWFAAHAYPDGHGLNIVNVILVDFRALDTMGEITVVMVAAASAYALLKGLRRTKGSPE